LPGRPATAYTCSPTGRPTLVNAEGDLFGDEGSTSAVADGRNLVLSEIADSRVRKVVCRRGKNHLAYDVSILAIAV
jgi:hypothetical protein